MVRLILNVQSLAVHFEKAAVRELVTSLSPETAISVQQHIPAAPKPAEAALPEAGASERSTVPEHAPVQTSNAPAGPQAAGPWERSEETPLADQRSRQAEDERSRQAAAKAREEALQREEAEERRKENDARLLAGEQARFKAEEEARQKVLDEQRMMEEKTRAQAEEHARARVEEETGEREREAATRRTAAGEAQKRENEEAGHQTGEPVPLAEAPIREERTHQDQLPGERKKGKRRTIAAVLGAALVLALYFVSVPRKLSEPPAGKIEAPAVAQKPSPPPVGPEKETPRTVQKNLKVPAPETLPPLYLTVPPDRVVLPEQEIYTVVKGDTLWGIAKRFTGNPRNYPRVARDNSIATPDLIFPGQRIRLVQEKN
jgi:nucleoid-associated protein YgaU